MRRSYNATSDVEFFEAASFLHFSKLKDRINGFFFGQVYKATGIDDHHRGFLLGLMFYLETIGFQLGFENFRIHYIFAATQRDNFDFLWMDGLGTQEKKEYD